jgi:gamma-glutamyltranspeptidase/glutathione hydrolase
VPAPPSSGLLLLQMLGTLEHFDLAAMDFNSPAYLRVLAEVAMRALTLSEDAVDGLHV